MNISRRNFLNKSALATMGGIFVPRFLKAYEGANIGNGNPQKKLIVIQFSGGNDGLNCIVPYQNDIYYKLRPTLAIPKNKVISLTDELGLNPALAPLQKLYDNGDWTIINSVGYPNPDRSHFRSMDIWHTASASKEVLSSGWLGRFLDKNAVSPHHALEINQQLNLALKGQQKAGFALVNPRQIQRLAQHKAIQNSIRQQSNHSHDQLVNYLYQTAASTVSSADYIFEKSKTYHSTESYPQGKLGKELQQVAELIIAGLDTQIYYITLGSFDTHSNQKAQQNKLLEDYAKGIAALVQDLKKNDFWKDTLIMTFSEFGRRVAENGSKGTDHGKGNNLYLMSGSLASAGFWNTASDLEKLNEGDINFEVDFRQIYATILDKWLQTNDSYILSESFSSLNLFS